MSVAKKIFLFVGSGCVIACIAGLLIHHSFAELHTNFEKMANETLPTIRSLEDLRYYSLLIITATNKHYRTRREFRANADHSSAAPAIDHTNLQENFTDFDQAFNQYEALVLAYFPEELEIYARIKQQGEQLKATSVALLALIREENPRLLLLKKQVEFVVIEQTLLAAIRQAIDDEQTEIMARREIYAHSLRIVVFSLFSALAILLAQFFCLWLFLSRAVTRPLSRLSDAVLGFGHGEFSQRVENDSTDEIGILATSFNKMANELEHTIKDRDREISERQRMEKSLAQALKKSGQVTDELQEALDEVRILEGFLPICSYCKKIRNDQGKWDVMEKYITERSEAKFSHSICDECMHEHYPDFFEEK
jgi:methyl-accepting chemotaxis protein